MFLLIDTSSYDTITLVLFGSVTVRKEVVAKNRELLACIDELLGQEKVTINDIAGIAVVVGAGSFTSTRIAVTVANTFAFARQIPVCAVTADEAGDMTRISKRLAAAVPGTLISATYSAEATIGK